MMRNFPTLFLGVLLLAFSGSLAAQAIADDKEEIPPDMKLVHTEKFSAWKFEFSEDGSTFIMVDDFDYPDNVTDFRLYRSSDFSVLEHKDKTHAWDLTKSAEENINSNNIWRDIRFAGYIDANTWYYVEQIKTSYKNIPKGIAPSCDRECDALAVHIKTIHPPQEIYAHSFDVAELGGRGHYRMATANSRYVFFGYGASLLDWRTNETRPFPKMPRVLSMVGFKLTRKGQILIIGTEKSVLAAPFKNDKAESLDIGGELAPDERHMVSIKDNGECVVWQFEERREVGRCGTGRMFGFGIEALRLAFSPDGKTFATSVNQKIRVYSIEPFRLLMEITAPQTVTTLALSSDGRLAGAYGDGRFRVWEMPSGKLVGQGEGVRGRSLAFQPGGNLLAAWAVSDVLFFELPARAGE
ncbi:MAG: hypothetical protein LBG78_00520 [Azoarcus sp.]|jgi:WD40 repeat protein|nr:hypothetical protein [Azoarcus sp.]